jgi:hypothetical protein
MSAWTTIKGLFGSGDTAEHVAKKAADGIYYGLDKIWHTEEEKSDALQKGNETFLALMSMAYEQNGPRSVNRRWLAWGITLWVLFNAQVAIVFAIIGKDEIVKKIISIADAFMIGWAFAAVVGFFFLVQFPRAMNKGDKKSS